MKKPRYVAVAGLLTLNRQLAQASVRSEVHADANAVDVSINSGLQSSTVRSDLAALAITTVVEVSGSTLAQAVTCIQQVVGVVRAGVLSDVNCELPSAHGYGTAQSPTL